MGIRSLSSKFSTRSPQATNNPFHNQQQVLALWSPPSSCLDGGPHGWVPGQYPQYTRVDFGQEAKNVTMCNRSLKQTAISFSSCEAEFYEASACAGELSGLAELFKELHYKVSVRLEMDSDTARHILQHIEIRCFTVQQWVRAKRLSVIRVDTKNNTADLFKNTLTDCVQEHLRRNWDCAFWIWLVVRAWVLLMVVRMVKTNDDN